MSAGMGDELDAMMAGEGDAALDVAGRRALRDGRRVLRVQRVVEVPGHRVARIAWSQQRALQRSGQVPASPADRRWARSNSWCPNLDRACGPGFEQSAATPAVRTPEPTMAARRRKERRSIILPVPRPPWAPYLP